MSEIRVTDIKGENGLDAVTFTKGINTTGIVTATGFKVGAGISMTDTGIKASNFYGSGAALTGITADDNTPAFLAYATTANAINIPNTTWTKIVFANELFDSDGKYASGTFTPTVAGKYVLSGMVEMEQQDDNTATYLKIYKNGSAIVGGRWFTMNPDGGGGGPNTSHFISTIATSDTDDYFELYIYQASGGRAVKNEMGLTSSHFSGYKLAGA